MKIKNLKYIVLLLLCSFAQQVDTIQDFEKALGNQDHSMISSLCDAYVEVETVKVDKVTSKSQVSHVLREFFSSHPIKEFEYMHIGTSPGGAKYAIGTYTTTNGTRFRTVIKLKNVNGQLLLESIKFSKE
ncbi:DUF4783 domain-containing protein [Cyclobacteriaceae bacterium]|nr:DUF4783 domain-containing protein [Cyclobacteriaceae bacterium]